MAKDGLLSEALALSAAKVTLAEAWRHSDFRALLIANLRSEMLRIVEPPEWSCGDRLELLTGHGCAPVDLKSAVVYAYDETIMNVHVIVTYEDSECDEIKLQAYDIHPPTELFRRTTKRAFQKWAKEERARNLDRKYTDTLKTLNDIKKRIDWNKPKKS
jgi:hypothetical protein